MPGRGKAPERSRTEPDAREMARILKSSGVALSPVQIGQLWKYHQFLRGHNQELNLTRIHNFESMVQKLYVDSILPGTILELPSPLMDLGTGAGMPGIPLKIAYPHLEILLAESRKNRVDFLDAVLLELGLKGIRNIGHGIGAASEVPVGAVITRALESIPQTLERISGSLAKGGLAVFMKGPHCGDEIEQALTRFSGRFRLAGDHAYRIPNSPHERRLVVFERTDAPLWVRKAELMGANLVRVIESEHNETFRNLRKLLAPRGIRKQRQALVAGRKQVVEVLARFPEKCVAWIGRGEKDPPPEGAPGHLLWYQLSPPLFETLDVFGTAAPLLLLKVEQIPEWNASEPLPEGCTLFVPFQDPENVGAVIRSAVAFGVAGIVLLAEAANPFHPKAVRASGGAVFCARLFEGPSINDLPETLPLVPLSREGTNIGEFVFPACFGLIPGIEGPGLPARLRGMGISVPIAPCVESLNAVVATAIALFAWSGSRGGK